MKNIFKKKIRVAIISAPFGKTGGPELTTIQLADALVDLGVDVTMFAPGDFKTKAKLVPTMKKSLWNMKNISKMTDFQKKNIFISSQVKALSFQDDFDIIHISSQRYSYAVAANCYKPTVLTMHSRMKKPDFKMLKNTGVVMVALTEKYKKTIGADEFIHLGLPIKDIKPCFKKGKGLIVVGRITDQKGIHIAIEIAQKAKKKLTIFGRIGNSRERKAYFEEFIKPHLKKGSIELGGEISNKLLMKRIASSEALLFPIIRPETFGRVSIEALACGTPIIGSKTDPLPEILSNKKTAFLSNDIEKLVEAAKNTDRFDRKECRKYAEDFFDSKLMAEKHLKLYRKIA